MRISNYNICPFVLLPIIGRLKVNMANIYFKQKNYPMAIKFYRMALDQISNVHTEMRQVSQKISQYTCHVM